MLAATAEYALRAVIALAELGPGETVLGRDLAERTGVPAAYLARILWELKHSGMVIAERGQGGGYRLARSPEEISLQEIIARFDPARANPGCLLWGVKPCDQLQPCPVHARWVSIRDAYVEFLVQTTVADLVAAGGAEPSPETT